MKTRLKWKLITILTVIASLFIFTGCKLGESLADVKEKYNLSARVTYYANGVREGEDIEKGAQFENTQGVKDVYYAAGLKPANIGKTKIPNVSMTYFAHKFLNWYYVARDAEGNPRFADEAQTVPIMSDEVVDFSKALEKDEHWIICADWLALPKVEIKLVCDELGDTGSISATTISGEEKSYKNGDVVWEDYFNDEGAEIQAIGSAPFTVSDKSYTYVEYYTDPACEKENLLSWPIQWTGEDVTVYVKYIKGDWTILKTAQDVAKVFDGYYGTGNYYLYDDIDCTGVTVKPNQSFSGTLQGNGYTISNLTANLEAKNTLNNKKSALFGNIKASAKITGVTFENTLVSYETNPIGTQNVNLYFLFISLEAGATVDSVTFRGKVSYKFAVDGTEPVKPSNLGGNATDGWTGWQYGEVKEGAETALVGFDMTNVAIEIVE